MQPPLANIFQPLVNVFEAILKFFHDDIGLGWGLAIIALTVLIRSLLLPLTLKQLRSMYRMAQFTPEIRKLRDKHGSDPQRLQRETLAFYKENRINPLGSVLPALAQLPVFLSLYYMLRTDLRHDICPGINPPGTSNPQSCGETAASHFLFIPDLTSRATGRSRRADRALRRLAALLVPALGEPDDGQDATDDLHRAALLVHRDRLAAAGRRARVLDHHEHVDDRPGRDRAQAPGSPAPGGAGRAGSRRRTWRAG
jgi:YidC/Oxa1 family membrane protein insertase